jgi:hypothetical protein
VELTGTGAVVSGPGAGISAGAIGNLEFCSGGLTVACESDIMQKLSPRLPDFTAGEQMWLNCFQSFRTTDLSG